MMAAAVGRISDRQISPDDGEILLVDKPAGWTSFDVVHRVRAMLGVRKVGHTGTLDPMATGLLILCTGNRTKEVDRFLGLEKEYEGEMILGERTESFDAEREVVERRSTDGITDDDVRDVFRKFTGSQRQIPPMWSAVKINGRRLYTYARKGVAVERKPREIFIASLEPLSISIPIVAFSLVCSKGTYVRALVNDIGQALGCGAHLQSLRRTRIGPYSVAEAATIQDLLRDRHTLDTHQQ